MSRPWHRVLWILPLLVTGAAGLERDRVQAAPQDREELLARWTSLSESEQEELRERYRRFQQLEPDVREGLVRGGRRLDALARRIYEGLPPQDRVRLDRLGAHERRAELRSMAAEEARELGQSVLEQLPDGLRERYEGASLGDRLEFLERFRARQERALGDVLVELSGLIGLEQDQRQALRSIPPELGRRRLLALLQSYASRQVEAGKLPDSLPPEAWSRLAAMDGPEFFHAMLRLRSAHPELWPTFGKGAARPEAEDPVRLRARMRLRSAFRPQPTEHIELLDLGPVERMTEKLRRKRGRILDVLGAEGLVQEEELAELAALPDSEFFSTVRRRFLGSGRR